MEYPGEEKVALLEAENRKRNSDTDRDLISRLSQIGQEIIRLEAQQAGLAIQVKVLTASLPDVDHCLSCSRVGSLIEVIAVGEGESKLLHSLCHTCGGQTRDGWVRTLMGDALATIERLRHV